MLTNVSDVTPASCYEDAVTKAVRGPEEVSNDIGGEDPHGLVDDCDQHQGAFEWAVMSTLKRIFYTETQTHRGPEDSPDQKLAQS